MVFLVAFLEGQLAYETVAAGARGYLSKESAREKICDAIVSVARGGTALAPEVQGGLAEQVQERERSDRPSRLTPREQECCS